MDHVAICDDCAARTVHRTVTRWTSGQRAVRESSSCLSCADPRRDATRTSTPAAGGLPVEVTVAAPEGGRIVA